MNKLSFNELIGIDYKFIFEYFDSPLSFIGQAKERNYLFYYISDDLFFISELKKDDIKKLSSFKNLKLFMDYLIELEKIQVINFNFDISEVKYVPLENLDFDFEDFLPSNDSVIDYDYNLNIDIPDDFDFCEHLSFPLETKDMTVRITDSNNSHIYRYDLIMSIMKYVKKSFEIVKNNLQEYGEIISRELMMKPYTDGSFKVNFLVSNEHGILKDKIDFYPILNTIDEVTVANRELNLELVNQEQEIDLIKNIDELYKVIKTEGVSVEFYDSEYSEKKLGRLSSNKIIDNNLEIYNDKISELNKLIKNSESINIPISRFITGSVIYNSVKIDNKGQIVKAKFDSELFKKIKNKTQHLTLDTDINVDLTVETYNDSNGDVVKQTTIIDSFRYLK